MVDYYIYILTNKNNHVLYTGVTSNLIKRVWQHKQKLVPGFTEKYNVNKLIFFEQFKTPLEAITREKKIKGWKRIKKNVLIEKVNPTYEDLYSRLTE